MESPAPRYQPFWPWLPVVAGNGEHRSSSYTPKGSALFNQNLTETYVPDLAYWDEQPLVTITIHQSRNRQMVSTSNVSTPVMREATLTEAMSVMAVSSGSDSEQSSVSSRPTTPKSPRAQLPSVPTFPSPALAAP